MEIIVRMNSNIIYDNYTFDGHISGYPNLSAQVRQFHVYHDIQRGLRNVVTPLLCLLGCLGNVVNLLVLTKIQKLKSDGGKDSGAQVGLMCLALSDTCFCVAVFPRGFVPSTTSLFKHHNVQLWYQVYGTGLVTTFILSSTWLTVVMTTIRYVAICHPFSARKVTGYVFNKTCYCLVFVLCFLCNIPSYFQYQIVDFDISGEMYYLVDIGHFNHNTIHGQIFTWLKVTFGIFLPAVVMAFCNVSLIVALRQSYRMRQQCSRQSLRHKARHSQRITLTLIVIVISFVMLVFPTEIMDFFSDSIKMNATKTETFLIVRSFANIFQVLNFACTFILYCAINVHFREALWELVSLNGRLKCCKRGATYTGFSYDDRSQRYSMRSTLTSQVHGRCGNGMELTPLKQDESYVETMHYV